MDQNWWNFPYFDSDDSTLVEICASTRFTEEYIGDISWCEAIQSSHWEDLVFYRCCEDLCTRVACNTTYSVPLLDLAAPKDSSRHFFHLRVRLSRDKTILIETTCIGLSSVTFGNTWIEKILMCFWFNSIFILASLVSLIIWHSNQLGKIEDSPDSFESMLSIWLVLLCTHL